MYLHLLHGGSREQHLLNGRDYLDIIRRCGTQVVGFVRLLTDLALHKRPDHVALDRNQPYAPFLNNIV